MTEAFTKADLRDLYGLLSRLEQPLAGPLSPADILTAGALCRKTEAMIRDGVVALERGRRILEWRLPPDYAPTMNELSSWHQRQPWRPKKVKASICTLLDALIAATPGLDLCGAQLARWVRVTRFTCQPNKIDAADVDAIGGKIPVDMLKKAGVVVDDSPRWMRREGLVCKTTRGNTHVLVEVFELAELGVPDDGPKDGPKPTIETRKRSATRAHLEETEAAHALPFGDG